MTRTVSEEWPILQNHIRQHYSTQYEEHPHLLENVDSKTRGEEKRVCWSRVLALACIAPSARRVYSGVWRTTQGSGGCVWNRITPKQDTNRSPSSVSSFIFEREAVLRAKTPRPHATISVDPGAPPAL